jgi:Galactose oxidase, central domain
MTHAMASRLLLFGGVLAALAASAVPARAQISPNLGWSQIANTQLQTVCPPNGFGGTGYSFATDCNLVVDAWSGGAFDSLRNRLIVFGGGHTDYKGNEVYAIDLSTLAPVRLTNPTLPLADGSCRVVGLNPQSTSNTGGSTGPNARHTYNGLAYMSHSDQMFVVGGSLASDCGAEANPLTNDMWLFSFATRTWTQLRPTTSGTVPGTNLDSVVAAYYAAHQMVYFHDRGRLYRFNPANTSVTSLTGNWGSNLYGSALTDPRRARWVMTGSGAQTGQAGANQIAWVDLTGADTAGTGTKSFNFQATSGDGSCGRSGAPGFAYDPIQDRYVCWNGGNTVYLLNPATWTWTTASFSGGPAAAELGTYGRFQYSPASGVFVVVNSVTQNAFTLRLTPPGGAAISMPPTNMQLR